LIEEQAARSGSTSGGFIRILFALVLVSAALYFARVLIEPIAFAFFGMALVWPVQRALEARMLNSLALLLTILVTLIVIVVFATAIIWSVGDIIHWVSANLPHFQALYTRTTQWLEEHGIFINEAAGLYDNRAFVGFLQDIALRLNSFAGFCLVVFLLLTFGNGTKIFWETI